MLTRRGFMKLLGCTLAIPALPKVKEVSGSHDIWDGWIVTDDPYQGTAVMGNQNPAAACYQLCDAHRYWADGKRINGKAFSDWWEYCCQKKLCLPVAIFPERAHDVTFLDALTMCCDAGDAKMWYIWGEGLTPLFGEDKNKTPRAALYNKHDPGQEGLFRTLNNPIHIHPHGKSWVVGVVKS